jgi:hypothetical protein
MARSWPLSDLALGQYEELARQKLSAIDAERATLAVELVQIKEELAAMETNPNELGEV